MDLRHFRYFAAIAEAGTFGRAASQLNLAQPALSRQMKDLEAETGTPLLRRTPKGVITTAAGDAFLARATELLNVTQDTIAAARHASVTTGGFCNIAIGRIMLGSGMAQVVAGLMSALPDVTIELTDVWADEQLPKLVAGQVDIGFVAPTSEPALTGELYGTIEFDAALLSAGHRLAGRDSLEPADLADEPVASLSPGRMGGFSDAVRAGLERAGIWSPQEFVYASPFSVVMVIAAGRGWTTAPNGMRERPPEGTVIVPVRGLSIRQDLQMVWRKDERRPVILRVLDALRALRDARPVPAERRAPGGSRAPPRLPPGLELRHLRYFAAVADEGGFSRAAERLGVTQASLSRQVADLEHMIGAPLLERTGRGVTITDAGRALHERSPRIFDVFDDTVAILRPARRGLASRCVVGAIQTLAVGRILGALTRLCAERWPRLELGFEDYPTPRQPDLLRDGTIDLGVCHSFPVADDDPELARERLIEDALDCVLLAPDHPLAGREVLRAGDLAGIPFLFVPPSYHPMLHECVFSILGDLGLKPRVEGEYDELYVVWALVAQKKGWALGFHSHREHPPSGLVAIPMEGLHLSWGLDLLWRRRDANPAVARVLEAMREVRATMAQTGRATLSASSLNPGRRRSAGSARTSRPVGRRMTPA